MNELRASAATGVAIMDGLMLSREPWPTTAAGADRREVAAPAERIIGRPHCVVDGVIRLCDRVGQHRLVNEDRVRASLDVLADFPTIAVHIRSDGGCAAEARSVYEVFRECGKPVRATISRALSGAAVIAMAATDLEIEPTGVFMVHAPAYDASDMPAGERLTASYQRLRADALDRGTERSVDIFARRTGLDRGTLRRMLAEDTYLDPAEVVRLGFADRLTEVVI